MSHLMLNTPEQIQMARLLAIRSGLRLEVKTNLRHSRNSVFKATKIITGEKTRVKCLDAMDKLLATAGL